MIFAIHSTVAWWRYLGENLGFDESIVVTDLRGEGDISIVDDFYRELEALRQQETPTSQLITPEEARDVIRRCRALRWLDHQLAVAMVHAMAKVLDRLLETLGPAVIVSFPIDRYVKDVLARRAASRGIPYLELTTAPFPGMCMFLQRGSLIALDDEPGSAVVEEKKKALIAPGFAPSYVPVDRNYSTLRFVRTFLYTRARSLAFKGISWLKRDTLNLHYLDAQTFLGHKPRLKDAKILRLVSRDWQTLLERTPRERRIFFGLQLFPEASIDYWIANHELIDHDECVIDAARAFSESGYIVLVKDHPLQFGYRQVEIIERLLELPNTVLVPYGVGAQAMLRLAGASFNFTGTVGLQAALAGLKSIVTPCYYSNSQDFIEFSNRNEIARLPARVESAGLGGSLEARQSRIVAGLLRGCFDGDLFSFKGFPGSSGSREAFRLAKSMSDFLNRMSERNVSRVPVDA
jgi:hypothetical protein